MPRGELQIFDADPADTAAPRLVLTEMSLLSVICGFGAPTVTESGRAVSGRSGSALASVPGVGVGADPFHVAWKKLAAALFITPASIIAAGAPCAGLVLPPQRELGDSRASGLLDRGELSTTPPTRGDGGFGGADFDSRRVRIDLTSSLGDPAVGDRPAGATDICCSTRSSSRNQRCSLQQATAGPVLNNKIDQFC